MEAAKYHLEVYVVQAISIIFKWVGIRMLCCGLVAGVFTSSVAKTPNQLTWSKDVSHAQIPNLPAVGKVGSDRFIVAKAQLRENVNPGKSRKDVSYHVLELTAEAGTPGAEFTLGVPPGTKLDGKTLWYADMFNHSSSIFVNKGARRVEYLPIQGIWLHGARKPEFKMMPIFEMHAVMHYSIRLEFGKRSGGKLPGKITFCGESDSFLKTPESILIGTFNAAIKTPGRVH